MILFYSNHCSSCQMLLDQIDRYSKKSLFKYVNIERILSKNLQVPKEVSVVPTLRLENNQYISGKQLFDYLLLPNRGILFKPDKENINNTDNNSPNNMNNNEPTAFSICSSSSDIFAFIEDENNNELNNNKLTNWCSINENITITTPTDDTSSSKSGRSDLPDVSKLRAERELELQNHLNNTVLPPVSNS